MRITQPRLFQRMRPIGGLVLAMAAAVGVLVADVSADEAAANTPAQDLAQKVRQAYENLERYHNKIELTVEQRFGGSERTDEMALEIAFDREADRFLIDGLSMRLASEDQTLRAMLTPHPGRHLEVEVERPLSYEALGRHIGMMLSGPVAMPDVVFLLADDPLGVLTAGDPGSARVLEADTEGDPHAGPRLAMNTGVGELVLTLDPESRLITAAVLELELDQPEQPVQAGEQSVTLYYEHDVRVDEAAEFDEGTFALSLEDSQAVDSMSDLVPSPFAHLEGKEAPQFTVPTVDDGEFSFSDESAPVVVLEFWATWCGPCRLALPAMERVHEWADEAHPGEVAIYAVNVGETQEQAKRYWERENLSLPVLMDRDGSLQRDYGGQGLPHTVIVAEGRIAHVHAGFMHGMEQTMKQQIDELLQAP